jgi:hypothetical protein
MTLFSFKFCKYHEMDGVCHIFPAERAKEIRKKQRKARAKPSITTVECCHRHPTSNYAPRAGKVLTAG